MHLLAGYERAFEWGGPLSQHVVAVASWIEQLYEDWGRRELAARWRANGTMSGAPR